MHAGGQTDGRAALDRAEPSRVSDGGPENRRGSGGRVFRRSWDVAADDDANAGLSRLSRFLGAFGAGSWVRSQAGRGPVFFFVVFAWRLLGRPSLAGQQQHTHKEMAGREGSGTTMSTCFCYVSSMARCCSLWLGSARLGSSFLFCVGGPLRFESTRSWTCYALRYRCRLSRRLCYLDTNSTRPVLCRDGLYLSVSLRSR
jgi:hypothetical protein